MSIKHIAFFVALGLCVLFWIAVVVFIKSQLP